MLQQSPITQSPMTEIAGHEMAVANTQPRRLQIALVLLLVALAVVIVKDREFWFDSDEAVVSEPAASPVSAKTNATPLPGKAAQTPVATTPAAKKHVASAKTSAKTAVVEPSHQIAAAQGSVAAGSPVVSTTRA